MDVADPGLEGQMALEGRTIAGRRPARRGARASARSSASAKRSTPEPGQTPPDPDRVQAPLAGVAGVVLRCTISSTTKGHRHDDAYILDAVRTPRGRGRPDGSLHPITPIQLAAQTLGRARSQQLDTKGVEDVVLGCASPIGEQGRTCARGRPGRGLRRRRARQAAEPLLRVGPRVGEHAAAQIMAGQADLVIGGGVESMSRVPIGADGGAWSPTRRWRGTSISSRRHQRN
jgi:hypothetical protein